MKRLPLFATLLAVAMPVKAQPMPDQIQLPTAVDLKAAFCLGYWRDFQPPPTQGLSEPFRSGFESDARQVQDTRKRIAAYLMPRSRFLDLDALLSASNAGTAYRQTVSASMMNCVGNSESEECLAISAKVKECRTGSFLPF